MYLKARLWKTLNAKKPELYSADKCFPNLPDHKKHMDNILNIKIPRPYLFQNRQVKGTGNSIVLTRLQVVLCYQANFGNTWVGSLHK